MSARKRFCPLPSVLIGVAVAWAGAGCDRATCIGMHPPTVDRNAPVLVNVEVLHDAQPNPWTLMLAVDYLDRDGDVGNGNMLVYVGASAPVALPLADSFATSELPLAATSGRVGVPLFFGQGAVADDNVLRLGFQLEDALNHFSNCYSLDLFVEVSLVDTLVPQSPSTQTALHGLRRVPCP